MFKDYRIVFIGFRYSGTEGKKPKYLSRGRKSPNTRVENRCFPFLPTPSDPRRRSLCMKLYGQERDDFRLFVTEEGEHSSVLGGGMRAFVSEEEDLDFGNEFGDSERFGYHVVLRLC